MIVSSSHGTCSASSWKPPHRSTMSSSPMVTATDAPTSPSSWKFSAKASFTAPKLSAQRPLMSTTGASLVTGGFDGAQREARVTRFGDLVALLAVGPPPAGVRHEPPRLAGDVGPQVPRVSQHEHRVLRHVVDVLHPF